MKQEASEFGTYFETMKQIGARYVIVR
jgi:hypothetical protein